MTANEDGDKQTSLPAAGILPSVFRITIAFTGQVYSMYTGREFDWFKVTFNIHTVPRTLYRKIRIDARTTSLNKCNN